MPSSGMPSGAVSSFSRSLRRSTSWTGLALTADSTQVTRPIDKPAHDNESATFEDGTEEAAADPWRVHGRGGHLTMGPIRAMPTPLTP